jgi:hypothetical protein
MDYTNSDKILFEEKQYLGYNKSSLLRRILLALFCFIAYYWSENPKPVDVSGIHIGSYPVQDIPGSGAIFFLLGTVVLLISAALVFILHIKTQVTEKSIILDGLWTSRKVKIELSSIVDAHQVIYDPRFRHISVYNLHKKGRIKFYTSGEEAVELMDRDGLKYIIGTRKPGELLNVILNLINVN